MLIKKIYLIATITLLILAWYPAIAQAETGSASTREYLQSQHLPALTSVTDWANSYGPGLRLTTKHYEIYTTLLDPLLLSEIPGFMESVYAEYNKQFPKPIESNNLFTVYLFANRKQWENFTKVFTGVQAAMYMKIKAGAYYLNGACVAYNIGRERTFSVIGHEGWHQFNSRHFKYRLPSWLDEGIAMQFETSRYDQGQGLFVFEPDKNLHRLGALKTTMMKGKMLPLLELLATNPGEVIVIDEDSVAAFYSQSYALVRFLREDNYGKRRPDYQKMLAGGLNGTWPLDDVTRKIASDRNVRLTVEWNRSVGPQLFERYIGNDIKTIEAQYANFCGKIVYRIRVKAQ